MEGCRRQTPLAAFEVCVKQVVWRPDSVGMTLVLRRTAHTVRAPRRRCPSYFQMFNYKPSILRYPPFRKPLSVYLLIPTHMVINTPMNRDTASSAWGRDLSHISSCHCPAGRRQLSQVLHFSSSACHLHTKNHTWGCPKVPALWGNISQKKWFGQLSFHETRSVWNLQSKSPYFLEKSTPFWDLPKAPWKTLRSPSVPGGGRRKPNGPTGAGGAGAAGAAAAGGACFTFSENVLPSQPRNNRAPRKPEDLLRTHEKWGTCALKSTVPWPPLKCLKGVD